MYKKFTIWYKTFTVEGHTQQDWEELPDTDVLGIITDLGTNEFNQPLHEWFSGCDWYWMKDGRIYQSNNSAEEPNVWLNNPAPQYSICKKGVWTTDEQMANINEQMLTMIRGGSNG